MIWDKEKLLDNYRKTIEQNVKDKDAREQALANAANFLKNEMFSNHAFVYKMTTIWDKKLFRVKLEFEDEKGFFIKK